MPRKHHPRGQPTPPHARGGQPQPAELRIIGGVHARRKLLYAGDERTRPMKDRVREAVFNLVGPAVVGMHAIDLFAGTGALGLEAISRGAARATFFERHFPTADVIGRNITALGVGDACRVIAADTFRWFRPSPNPLPGTAKGSIDDLGRDPWLVFCSPPYVYYVDRGDDIVALLTTLSGAAPAGSVLVVESDRRFDATRLPATLDWDTRDYPPARIAIARK